MNVKRTVVGTCVYGGRFISGRPMSGHRKTDATFLRRGTAPLFDKARPPTKWSYLPEWKRSLIRLGTSAAVTEHAVLAVTDPNFLIGQDGMLGAYGSYRLALSVRKAVLGWEVRNKYAVPMWAVLTGHPILGFPREDSWENWLEIPYDVAINHEAKVIIQLPKSWIGEDEQRRALTNVVSRKLGLGDLSASWHSVGNPWVSFGRTPEPPKMVGFSDHFDLMASLPSGKVLAGIGAGSTPCYVDMVSGTPHIAMSMATGGGKSQLLGCIVCQLLRQGASVDICDAKRFSADFLEGLPNLKIWRDVGSIWDAVRMFRAEMERRLDLRAKDPAAKFERRVLVMEEMNALFEMSEEEWEARGHKGKMSYLRDLLMILTLCRAVNMNVICIFQNFESKYIGGGTARGQFGFFFLGRFKPRMWDMLIGDKPRMKSKNSPGRMVAHNGESGFYIQGLMTCDKDKRDVEYLKEGIKEWVLAGLATKNVNLPVPEMEMSGTLGTSPSPGETPDDVRDNPKEWDTVTRKKFCELMGIESEEALRKLMNRDDTCPAPNGKSGNANTYVFEELRVWYLNRSSHPNHSR